MKGFWKGLKGIWDEKLRPLIEPVLTMIVKSKVAKEAERHL